jgi:hypothetical protein
MSTPSSTPYLEFGQLPEWLVAVTKLLGKFSEHGLYLIDVLRDKPCQRPSEMTLDNFILRFHRALMEALEIKAAPSRRESLFSPPAVTITSESEDMSYSEIYPGESAPTIASQFTTKIRTDLAFEFGKYLKELSSGLSELYAHMELHWISPPVMDAIRADPAFPEFSDTRDVVGLVQAAKKVCLRLGHDSAGDIEEQIDAHFQIEGEKFAKFKAARDVLQERYRIYNQLVSLTQVQMVKKLLRTVNPAFFQQKLLELRKLLVLPDYVDVCLQFQAEEDALEWSVKNIQRRAPTIAPSGSKLLMAGAGPPPPTRERVRNDRGTFGDYRKPHCPHCVERTGHYYRHTADQCNHPPDSKPTHKPAVSKALLISQFCKDNSISREEFEAQA